MRTVRLIVLYVVILVIVWVVQWRFAPTWLVGSRAGLQTLLQVIPAAVIALFALAFAALFVIVQQVASVFSSRAPLVLLLDQRLQYLIARAIILAGAALLLGGQVGDIHQPSTWTTAAVATLTLAAAYLTFSYGRAVQVLGLEYSMPRTFVKRVVESAPSNLSRTGAPDLLDILISLLGSGFALSRWRWPVEVNGSVSDLLVAGWWSGQREPADQAAAGTRRGAAAAPQRPVGFRTEAQVPRHH
jgi:hypothetical protein